MLGEAKIRELLSSAIARSPADETEVVLLSGDQALTRFANNTIHQNVAETDVSIAVRVAVGRHLGSAITNRPMADALGRAIDRATSVARLAPETADFPGLPEPQTPKPVRAFDDAVAGASARWRAERVREVLRLAQSSGAMAAGALCAGIAEVAVANSRGVFCYHAGTRARFNLVISKDGASGHAQRAAWRLDDLDFEGLARTAVQRALRARQPRPVEPGTYPVVLEPYAVQDIVGHLAFSGMGALAVQEGRSWMNGRLGDRAMSERITIIDDGCDTAGLPMPFDHEGVPKERVTIVDRGVPVGPVYDTTTAAKEGRRSTGHAVPRAWPEFAAFGPLPVHLFVAAGDAAIEEMVQQVSRGLYVTRFWYTRLVHPRDCVVTGMTRDGVFWIEDGEIAYPVRNLRFTQGYVQALAAVNRVGADTWLLSGGFGSVRVPALSVSEFTFTGVTEF
ncbi:MAG: TldD/PmbA family protein [Armatimonadota bacterium]|nr:TldD/PmbA family protein [Armatimonadota bacterium]MDR5697223.1 TldD/PmbA family protein [Armatimonadota bacterium]